MLDVYICLVGGSEIFVRQMNKTQYNKFCQNTREHGVSMEVAQGLVYYPPQRVKSIIALPVK
jgi:hypothetical protein